MKLDASDARYSAVPTISDGWPRRCSGKRRLAWAWNASTSQALEMSVRNGPTMIPFDRTVGPNVTAKPTVSVFRPALAAA